MGAMPLNTPGGHNPFEPFRDVGTSQGAHAGAKSWAEDPSMVISLTRALDPDGRQVGVEVEFKKDRAATI